MLFYPQENIEEFYTDGPAACDDCGLLFPESALRNGVCAAPLKSGSWATRRTRRAE